MLNFIVLTLFNEMFDTFLSTSIIKRAIENKKLNVNLVNIRDFSGNKNGKVDDTPYGGGAGMVMEAEPISKAIEHSLNMVNTPKYKIIYMSPRGKVLTHKLSYEISRSYCDTTYIILCGHYEGVDERVLQYYGIEEISIGDYVLTGGELPAMVLIDSAARLVPGTISESSLIDESHSSSMLEYPQYTKPAIWKGIEVPEVLLSGNHKNIEQFRKDKSLELTMKNRPDLLNLNKKY